MGLYTIPAKNSQPRRHVQSLIFLTQYCILSLLALFVLLYVFFGSRAEALLYPASVIFVVLSIWSVWSWKTLTGNLFDPYVLFLIAAVLFNGGHAFLEVLRINEFSILDGKLSPDTTLKALFLVILGMASFHSGALISAACRKKGVSQTNPAGNAAAPTMQDVRMVGWGLLLVSFIPAALLLRDAVNVVMSSGYFALY